MTKKGVVIKENGREQRLDIALNLPVANALADMIKEGKRLHPGKNVKEISLEIEENGESKKVLLKKSVFQNWIQRNNVIPETGVVLRKFLDDAREEYRVAEIKRQEALIVNTSRDFMQTLIELPTEGGGMEVTRLVNMDTPKPTGFHAKGKVVTKFIGHNPKMVEAKLKGAMFLLERLNPERYAAKSETKNSHLVYSLADLRKAKDFRDAISGDVK